MDDIYQVQNFGRRIGYGEKPALLVIDLQAAFTDPVKLGCDQIQAVVRNTAHLLGRIRSASSARSPTRSSASASSIPRSPDEIGFSQWKRAGALQRQGTPGARKTPLHAAAGPNKNNAR